MPGAFNRLGELALVLGRHATSLTGEQAAVRIEKLLQKFRILVVYVFNIVLRKVTLLLHIFFSDEGYLNMRFPVNQPERP